jgi:uncharacterized protein (DUF885 family)
MGTPTVRTLAAAALVLAHGTTTMAQAADAAFERAFGDGFFDRVWQLHPDDAIGVGYYKYADRLVVPDEAARTRELAALDEWSRTLHGIDPARLSPLLRADWEVLDKAFERERYGLTEYRAWQWDPSVYNVADPFALLLTRNYVPLDERLRAVLARLENVPAYYGAAKRNVHNPTREHTRLAIEQNRGALDVFGDDLTRAIDEAKLGAAERAELSRRVGAARGAIEDYVAWLEALEARLAEGDARSFRIGRAAYDQRFELEIQSGDTAEALYAHALEEKTRLLERMALFAELLWPKYFPNAAPPSDRLTLTARVIERLSEQHVAREELYAEISREIPMLERWVTDHGLLTLDPTKPLIVRETPVYERGVAIAGIQAPGPYDPAAPTYYDVTPLDALSAERAESYLREYNAWMLPILNIHEAVPGHYVQLVYANRSPSRIKSIYANGAMIEGWAVYAERMMLESGFGDDKAESWLIYSKWNLRSVCNVILDYGVHVLGMSEEQALDLLMREAFQTRQEATEKWRRVQLTSVQLTSYFAGYSAILALREELQRARPESFDLKRFHEQFLSYGNAPVRVIRDLMLADRQ